MLEVHRYLTGYRFEQSSYSFTSIIEPAVTSIWGEGGGGGRGEREGGEGEMMGERGRGKEEWRERGRGRVDEYYMKTLVSSCIILLLFK